MAALDELAWPPEALADAIHALAGALRLPAAAPDAHRPDTIPSERLGIWIRASARSQQLDAIPVRATCAQLPSLLRTVPGLIVQLPRPDAPRFLVVVRGSRSRVTVIAPDRSQHRVRLSDVAGAIAADAVEQDAARVARVVDDEPSERVRTRVRAALIGDRLEQIPLAGCWAVRLPAGRHLWRTLTFARIPQRLAGLASGYAVQYVLWLAAWVILGRAALYGATDATWLSAWILLMVSALLLRASVIRTQGQVGVDLAALLKRRLLEGTLRLDPEALKSEGVGRVLGRVVESEAVESLSIGGGFTGLFAVIELFVAVVALAAGVGALAVIALSLWIALAGALAWMYATRRGLWTDARGRLTHDTVEKMLGHRTRLAQEPEALRHRDEERALRDTLETAARLDRIDAWLRAGVPRGWLLIALAIVSRSLMAGATPAALAVEVGGMLLAYRALRRLVLGVNQLAGAAVAWRSVKPLFDQAAAAAPISPPHLLADRSEQTTSPLALDARHLVYHYAGQRRAALDDVSVALRDGDRLLLEGPSGGGKSTLASLVGGIRTPQSGSLLLHGVDQQFLGADAWRERVVVVPQFHDNHILVGSLAFNLLMGRQTPIVRRDLAEAESVCRELGLGDLLSRLPAGLMQLVGESGWQLSHGERSRVFMARALLQNPDVLVLDESFAALDPDNLKLAMDCVQRRARTLLVIAHP